MKIYPNPRNGVFNFKLKHVLKSDINISISDVYGKVIANKFIDGKNLSEELIDLSEFSKGIYILKVQFESQFYLQKLQID
jgi:hypothetical protein